MIARIRYEQMPQPKTWPGADLHTQGPKIEEIYPSFIPFSIFARTFYYFPCRDGDDWFFSSSGK